MLTKTSTCRKCGKPIKFIRTTNGKWLPVNPVAVYYSLIGNKDRIVTSDGRIVACTIVENITDCIGFIPHWATCEYANDFRRDKKNKEQAKSKRLTGFEAVALF